MTSFPKLTDREREILTAVVQQFVLTANPVGSRQLSRRTALNLSPATIRNVMADLEERGLLSHPHTSAGRVPSDLGYRLYVDQLMETRELSLREREAIEKEFEGIPQEFDDIFAVTTKVLSSASKLLGIIIVTAAEDAVLQRIELVRIAEGRMLIVISIESGPVRTIVVELEQTLAEAQQRQLVQLLNARLAGLRLSQIRGEIGSRIGSSENLHPQLVRFFIDSAEKLFSVGDRSEVRIGGRAEVISQPEFSDPKSMRGIIELIEDQDIVIHLLQAGLESKQEPVVISIGSENIDSRAKDLSIMTCRYQTPSASGKLGVIGPTRMDYSRLKSLVSYTARTIRKHLTGGTLHS